jgi:Ribbon-helix-helix protein, copG family
MPEKMTVQTVKLDAEILRSLKIHSAYTGKSQQEILRCAVIEYLERHKSERVEPVVPSLKKLAIHPDALKRAARKS